MSNENETKQTEETKVKPKKKIVFAKDKKEAITAIVVFAIFILNSAYMITKYYIENQAETQNQNPIKSPIELIKK